MEKLHIESTRTTPYLLFDPSVAILELRGRSSPENSLQFYSSISTSLDEYTEKGCNTVLVNFALEYFNTSTSKVVFDLFKKLSKINEKGKKVTVNWFYEEDDDMMMEVGEDYADMFDVEFCMKTFAA
uniref:DUF1987 domain-containing protein n=1 Tax=Fulvivirga sp. TaxID=1931237 RepID=UPI00404B108F